VTHTEIRRAPRYEYEGDELKIFQHAVQWKSYYRGHIRPYLRGRVLEVGGGIGATSQLLCDGEQQEWVILEPDGSLIAQMQTRFAEAPLPAPSRIVEGTLAKLSSGELFDAILYIDVLEHIEDDRGELLAAADHLAPGGRVIVLAPAHPFLYSEFDRAIGHFRRYSAKSLRAAAPSALRVEKLLYLDSVGMIASLANRLLLRSGQPSLGQIRFWDSVLVRLSRIVDPIPRYRLGKSVLAVWRRQP
jgi:SAM-dependent methyltransferase